MQTEDVITLGVTNKNFAAMTAKERKKSTEKIIAQLHFGDLEILQMCGRAGRAGSDVKITFANIKEPKYLRCIPDFGFKRVYDLHIPIYLEFTSRHVGRKFATYGVFTSHHFLVDSWITFLIKCSIRESYQYFESSENSRKPDLFQKVIDLIVLGKSFEITMRSQRGDKFDAYVTMQ